ncbi:MAG TPA: hypothetical protein VLE50_07815, partial [Cellvibrio sp.]|nr:hypothetical protein [Cellvibrio sp.]
MHVGELLKLIDELGVANNTIVQYSTDNGRRQGIYHSPRQGGQTFLLLVEWYPYAFPYPR